MGEMTIQLRVDPASGKKDIIVSLKSDEDLLPHEHEEQHRQLVDKLIEGGALKAGEVGQIIVEREEEEIITQQPIGQETPVDQRESQAEGN